VELHGFTKIPQQKIKSKMSWSSTSASVNSLSLSTSSRRRRRATTRRQWTRSQQVRVVKLNLVGWGVAGLPIYIQTLVVVICFNVAHLALERPCCLRR
jgi:hypothetical protein